MTTLLLVRHGATEWNVQHRIQGQQDPPLSELGRIQAAAAAPVLAARSPTAIIASDLRRCTETAAPLAELTGRTVHLDARLRERAYGQWEGLTLAEIARRWPEAYARKQAGADAADLGHGIEHPADVMKRAGEALRAVAESHPGGTVVVATHGGTGRYGMVDLLGWPTDQLRTVSALVNCHYSELRLDPARGWTLVAHNVSTSTSTGEPGYE